MPEGFGWLKRHPRVASTTISIRTTMPNTATTTGVTAAITTINIATAIAGKITDRIRDSRLTDDSRQRVQVGEQKWFAAGRLASPRRHPAAGLMIEDADALFRARFCKMLTPLPAENGVS